MQNKSKLSFGILAGLGAGFFWGLVFLVPQAIPDFSPLEIAYGRFFFFGIFSLFYIRGVVHLVRRLEWSEIVTVLALSAAGFWLYTLGLVQSVKMNGGVFTTLVIGLLPITISLAERRTLRLQGKFISGLLLILLGLFTLELLPFLSDSRATMDINGSGYLILLFLLAIWTWYGIRNSAFLKEHQWIPKRDFTSLMGTVSLLCMTVIAIPTLDFRHLIHHHDLSIYLMWSVILGLGSTWMAYWLWNICSHLCPPQISGPLIVSETICGVLFTFIYHQRLPGLLEFAAIALFLAGALLSVISQVDSKKADL